MTRWAGWTILAVPLAGGLAARRVAHRPVVIQAGLSDHLADGFNGEAFVATSDGQIVATDGWGNTRSLGVDVDARSLAIAFDPSGFVTWSEGAIVNRADRLTGQRESFDTGSPAISLAAGCGGTNALVAGSEVLFWPFQGEVTRRTLSQPAAGIQSGRECGQVTAWGQDWVGSIDVASGHVTVELALLDADSVRRSGATYTVLRDDRVEQLDDAGAILGSWVVPEARMVGGSVGPGQPTVLDANGRLWALP